MKPILISILFIGLALIISNLFVPTYKKIYLILTMMILRSFLEISIVYLFMELPWFSSDMDELIRENNLLLLIITLILNYILFFIYNKLIQKDMHLNKNKVSLLGFVILIMVTYFILQKVLSVGGNDSYILLVISIIVSILFLGLHFLNVKGQEEVLKKDYELQIRQAQIKSIETLRNQYFELRKQVHSFNEFAKNISSLVENNSDVKKTIEDFTYNLNINFVQQSLPNVNMSSMVYLLKEEYPGWEFYTDFSSDGEKELNVDILDMSYLFSLFLRQISSELKKPTDIKLIVKNKRDKVLLKVEVNSKIKKITNQQIKTTIEQIVSKYEGIWVEKVSDNFFCISVILFIKPEVVVEND
ncbi:hypothetical protein [Listeria welshimeri]|uniref:hypothetical protein n=1 Tax=Listeria welshimeri TaxID=1643 RepID=UPI001E469475|nr:hypothetical protein [Listeria welshimeri]